MRQLGLTFGPSDYALLGLTLFAGILVALSIAIILGAFAESVKSVQALLTPLMVLLLVPYFLTLFLDLSDLPDAARMVGHGDSVHLSVHHRAKPVPRRLRARMVRNRLPDAVVRRFVVIAARVFSSDRILTMKLKIGRRR